MSSDTVHDLCKLGVIVTAFLSLVTIGIVLFILLNAAKEKQPKKPMDRDSGDHESYSSSYSCGLTEYEGEGSDLIRKFSGSKGGDDPDSLSDEIYSGKTTRPKKRAAKPVKHPVVGSIAFDYIDTKHELSSRVVKIKEVDARHISGYCQTARAFRTFLIEGIVSDVTDTETGEVMPVDQWIRQAKKAGGRASHKK